MKRLPFPAALGLALALCAPGPAATPPKAGTYELVRLSPTSGVIYGLVKITPKDSGVDGELVAAHPQLRGLDLKDVTLSGDTLRVVLNGPSGDMTFEGRVPKVGADTVLGTFETGGRLFPARLSHTDKMELTLASATVRLNVPEPMSKAATLSNRSVLLRARARRTQDADEKAKLLKEADEADKEARAEVPKLYREVVEKHADSPAASLAAQNLLRQAGKAKEPADTVAHWAALVLKAAQPYGPRYEAEVATRIAELLTPQNAYADIALDYAQRAEKALTAKDTAEKQETVLGTLAAAQRKAGKVADADQTEARLAKVQAELDRDYLAKMPPFKPEAYAGRKAAGDRAVVLELFTGAECPPCVAADVAFDVLAKTYKPTELILIQYHMHIPGPDPLTNPSSEARWDYYRERFSGEVLGTPTTVFEGKPQAGGGGAIGAARNKYHQYRAIIDKLLEEPARAAVSVDASRQGDAVTVRASVSDLKEPGADKRLRLVLVEESVRYAGGNRLRFHHEVVRAMPGGADGFKLTEKDSKHTATVNLDELRGELNHYLDTYAAEKRPFPRAARPMAMRQLKVIALVQDDKTGEILQAAVADVGGERAAK